MPVPRAIIGRTHSVSNTALHEPLPHTPRAAPVRRELLAMRERVESVRRESVDYLVEMMRDSGDVEASNIEGRPPDMPRNTLRGESSVCCALL